MRLARAVGDDAIGGEGSRGWVRVNAKPPAVMAQDVALVVQHPKGRPLELAFGAVLSYNGNATRVRYDMNTEKGSSGSPCLITALEPFALHNAGGPGDKFQYNQGVPLRRLIEHMTTRGVAPFWA